jgi:hypothetical protein
MQPTEEDSMIAEMKSTDALCQCGHPRSEHCGCGQHCLHPGEPVYITGEAKKKWEEMLPALSGTRLDAAKRLLEKPVSYKILCQCSGWKPKELAS